MRRLLLSLCLLPAPALADEAEWEAQRVACQSAAETVEDLRNCKQTVFYLCTEAAMGAPGAEGACQFAEHMAWEGELTRLWAEVGAMADERGLGAEAKATQQAWLAYRDASCAYQKRFAAVTAGDEMLESEFCLSEMTAERVFEFRLMLVDG